MDWARGIRVNRNGHRRECSLMLVLVLVLLLHRVLAIVDRNLVGCPLRIAQQLATAINDRILNLNCSHHIFATQRSIW